MEEAVTISVGPSHFECRVSGPDGEWFEIPRELYSALHNFLVKEKPPGSLEVNFVRGGVTAVVAKVRLK